jgi:cytochrome P450
MNAKYRNAINKFPGPATIPIFGNALQTGKESADFYRKATQWAEEYKKEGMFRLWLGTRAIINIYKAEHLEVVMSSSSGNSKKSINYKLLEPWLRDGLLMSYGEKWQRRRKLLTPTFHYSILEEFMSVFRQQSEKLVGILDKKSGWSRVQHIFLRY